MYSRQSRYDRDQTLPHQIERREGKIQKSIDINNISHIYSFSSSSLGTYTTWTLSPNFNWRLGHRSQLVGLDLSLAHQSLIIRTFFFTLVKSRFTDLTKMAPGYRNRLPAVNKSVQGKLNKTWSHKHVWSVAIFSVVLRIFVCLVKCYKDFWTNALNVSYES